LSTSHVDTESIEIQWTSDTFGHVDFISEIKLEPSIVWCNNGTAATIYPKAWLGSSTVHQSRCHSKRSATSNKIDAKIKSPRSLDDNFIEISLTFLAILWFRLIHLPELLHGTRADLQW
jgi:hypothetical protein